MIENLYRYERFSHGEEFCARIVLRVYKVLRTTPGGFWIEYHTGCEKWVPNDTRKRFAYPTPEEAMVNFTKRTQRCIKILKSQLRIAEKYLNPEVCDYKLNSKYQPV